MAERPEWKEVLMAPPFKTHCKNGHPFDDENTRICSTTGRRKCRACQAEFARASSERQRRARGIVPVVALRDAAWVQDSEYVVEDCGYETPCWIWQRAKTGTGYGYLHKRWENNAPTGQILAHRLSYERAVGHLANELEVHHKCEVPACINPEHLEALTSREHLAQHGRMVLGPERAAEIRRRLAAGEVPRHLALEFGVTHGSITHIREGRSYADAA